MQITKDNTLKEILGNPGAEEILKKNSVPCMSCPMAQFELNSLKIGQVAKMYHLDLNKIIKDLNSLNNHERKN